MVSDLLAGLLEQIGLFAIVSGERLYCRLLGALDDGGAMEEAQSKYLILASGLAVLRYIRSKVR